MKKALELSFHGFTPALVALEARLIYRLIEAPRVWIALLVVCVPYLAPLAVFRSMNALFPLVEGGSYLDQKTYVPWLVSFRCQLLFYTFPALERPLTLFPALYSAWLRAWGSTIGKNILWNAHSLIGDRSLLTIGDNVFFGHAVLLSSHIIKPTRIGRPLMYLKRIEIGSNVFVGAMTRVGPGARIGDNTVVPAGSDLYPNDERFLKAA